MPAVAYEYTRPPVAPLSMKRAGDDLVRERRPPWLDEAGGPVFVDKKAT